MENDPGHIHDEQVTGEPLGKAGVELEHRFRLQSLLGLVAAVCLAAAMLRFVWFQSSLVNCVIAGVVFAAPVLFIGLILWYCPRERNQDPTV